MPRRALALTHKSCVIGIFCSCSCFRTESRTGGSDPAAETETLKSNHEQQQHTLAIFADDINENINESLPK